MVLSVLLALWLTQPSSGVCQAPEHAQFDFWLGEWEVYSVKGNRAGHNTITRTHGGCVVVEQWNGSGGVTGSSFNIYTPATGKWHQLWVDSGGTLLQLEGEFRDGSMRLQGAGLTPQGRMTSRITWTKRPDGTVRQVWETSTDDGKTWQASFDGTYRKAVK